MMGVYPPGSAVQLTDDRYALVVSVNSPAGRSSRACWCTSGVPREEALLLDLEHADGLGIRRSLRPQLPATTLAYLAPRRAVAYFFEPVRRVRRQAGMTGTPGADRRAAAGGVAGRCPPRCA